MTLAHFTPPDLSLWPEILLDAASAHATRLDLDNLTDDVLATLKPGQTLLLSGTLYTGRDAAHKRMIELLDTGEFPGAHFRIVIPQKREPQAVRIAASA